MLWTFLYKFLNSWFAVRLFLSLEMLKIFTFSPSVLHSFIIMWLKYRLLIYLFLSWGPGKLSCIISLILSFPEFSLLFNFTTSTHQILDSLVWSSNFQLFSPIVHTCLFVFLYDGFSKLYFLYYHQTFIFSIYLFSKCSFLLSYFLEQLWEKGNKFLLSHLKNFT